MDEISQMELRIIALEKSIADLQKQADILKSAISTLQGQDNRFIKLETGIKDLHNDLIQEDLEIRRMIKELVVKLDDRLKILETPKIEEEVKFLTAHLEALNSGYHDCSERLRTLEYPKKEQRSFFSIFKK